MSIMPTVLPRVMDLMDQKVARLIIGTHHNRWLPPEIKNATMGASGMSAKHLSPHYIHEQMRELLVQHGWRIVWDVPMNDEIKCVLRHLRGNYMTPNTPDRFDWARMLSWPGCTHATPRGPVAHWDGEIIADNPRLVDVSRPFSLADTELKVDDLKHHTGLAPG